MLGFMFRDDHQTEYDDSETMMLVRETMRGQNKDNTYQKRLQNYGKRRYSKIIKE